jgi:hypothetical protein
MESPKHQKIHSWSADLYISAWKLESLSTRLSDFIQEGIESGTFDNYGDLKLCVTNFLTLHQK